MADSLAVDILNPNAKSRQVVGSGLTEDVATGSSRMPIQLDKPTKYLGFFVEAKTKADWISTDCSLENKIPVDGLTTPVTLKINLLKAGGDLKTPAVTCVATPG